MKLKTTFSMGGKDVLLYQLKSKKPLLIAIVIFISLVSSIALLKTVDMAFSTSAHPVISLIMRAVFGTILSIPFILRKKEILIYYFILSFPFMRIAFSGINLLTIFSFILVVVYLKKIVTLVKNKENIFRIPFIIIVFCFLYTTLISKYPYEASERVLFYISLGGIYFVLTVFVKSEKEFKIIFRLMLFTFFFCVLISFWQYFFGINSVNFSFSKYNSNVRLFSLDRRIPSIFTEAQGAGQFFCVMTLLALGLRKTFMGNKRWLKILVTCGGCALCLTISRLAIISFICGLIFVMCFSLNFRKVVAVLVLLLFLSIFGDLLYNVVTPVPIKERFLTFDSSRSFDFRFNLWQESLPIITNNPLGCGLGGNNLYSAGIKQKVFIMKDFKENRELRKYSHFENSYLGVLYSLGLFGFIGLIMLFINYFSVGFKILKKRHFSQEGRFSLYLMAAMAAWLLCAFTSPQISEIQPMIIFTSLLALMNSFKNIYLQSNE